LKNILDDEKESQNLSDNEKEFIIKKKRKLIRVNNSEK